MDSLCRVIRVPTGTIEERRRKLVDQVVGGNAERIDFPELKQIGRAVVDSGSRNLEVGVLGFLAVYAFSVSLLDTLSTLSQTHASKQLGTSGRYVRTAFTHVGYVERVTHVGCPTGTDLLLHVRGQDVGNEVMSSGTGQDRIHVEGLSRSFWVRKVVVVQDALRADMQKTISCIFRSDIRNALT